MKVLSTASNVTYLDRESVVDCLRVSLFLQACTVMVEALA